MVNKRCLFAKLFAFFLCLPLKASAQTHTVCAIGDSQVEPGAMLVSELQRQLGPGYSVIARGRRSWTTQQWIEAGDFGTVCGSSDIILISLGGNDRNHHVPLTTIDSNVTTLIAQLPTTARLVYHMTIPRYYRPRLALTLDGVHLTLTGARTYAAILVPHLRP
jgi:lysophospholipase L1-like esterase